MALARIVRRVSVMVIRISIVLEGKRYRGGLCGWRRNGGGADRPRGARWLHCTNRFTPAGDVKPPTLARIAATPDANDVGSWIATLRSARSEEHTSELQSL